MIVVDASAMVELLLDAEIGRRVDDHVLGADATLVTRDKAMAMVTRTRARVELVT